MKQNKRKTKTKGLLKRIIATRLKRDYYGYQMSKHYTPRRIARNVAKENMKMAGFKHVNSIFSHYWRELVIVK